MTESESENEFENAFTTRQYESQNSSDDEDENNLPTNNAKKSRVRLNWVYKSTFENKDQSDAWLQNDAADSITNGFANVFFPENEKYKRGTFLLANTIKLY